MNFEQYFDTIKSRRQEENDNIMIVHSIYEGISEAFPKMKRSRPSSPAACPDNYNS